MSVDTLSFIPKTAEPIELTHTIDLYKYVRWKEREISEESYRPIATSPASSLKFMFDRLGVFLQIVSHIYTYNSPSILHQCCRINYRTCNFWTWSYCLGFHPFIRVSWVFSCIRYCLLSQRRDLKTIPKIKTNFNRHPFWNLAVWCLRERSTHPKRILNLIDTLISYFQFFFKSNLRT